MRSFATMIFIQKNFIFFFEWLWEILGDVELKFICCRCKALGGWLPYIPFASKVLFFTQKYPGQIWTTLRTDTKTSRYDIDWNPLSLVVFRHMQPFYKWNSTPSRSTKNSQITNSVKKDNTKPVNRRHSFWKQLTSF